MKKYIIKNPKDEDTVYEMIKSSKHSFYVYGLIDPRDNHLFYVGKGSGERCFEHWFKAGYKNSIKVKLLDSLRKNKLQPLYCIFFWTNNEERAYNKEEELILKYGCFFNKTGYLTNLQLDGKSVSLNKTSIIDRFKAIHGTKYNYSLIVYKGYKFDVEIICKEHGSFWQLPPNHEYGKGCPKCAPNFAKDLNYYINLAKIAHGDNYDYSKSVYTNAITPVEIICKKHGPFWQTFQTHNKGHGCNKCGREVTLSNITRRIVKLSLDGSFISSFNSIAESVDKKEASSRSCVQACCSGRYKSHNGYDWWYLEDYIKYLKDNKIKIPKELKI